jgi:hypothetical protein
LALTFPDICCQVENRLPDNQNSNRTMYINWVNNHVDFEDFHFPLSGFEPQTFTGEMCYSLRCKVLHNGNTDVNNARLGVIVDDFILTTPKDEMYYHGYKYCEKQESDGKIKKITYIAIDYLCERLCDSAEKFYNEWECKADFDKHSF